MNYQSSNSSIEFLTKEKTQELVKNKSDSRYMVMVRIGSEETLEKISPFLIKKIVDKTCKGEVEQCKKLRNGTILIKTKNKKQSDQLKALTYIAPNVSVEVSEHNTLNSTKGVFYTNSLRGMTEEDIIEELKTQKVTHIKKILKKDEGNLKETGLYIVTFSSQNLPEQLHLGYEQVKVRIYIPLPLRCFNCFRFGHLTKFCNSKKLCYNCSNPSHTNQDNNEDCTNNKNCINCQKRNIILNLQHSPLDKNCPTFIKEKEIQTIKTLRKVDTKEAITIYEEIHCKTFSIRSSMSYDDLETFDHESNITPTNKEIGVPMEINLNEPPTNQQPSKNQPTLKIIKTDSNALKPPPSIKILPSNISQRSRRQLRAIKRLTD